MALAYDSAPTTIKLVIRDLGGNSATKEFAIPTAVWDPAADLFSALVTIRDALVTAYNAVIDGLIFRAIISVGQTETAATVGVGNIEDLASIVANLSTLGKNAVIQIPTPNVGIFNGASGKPYNVVDIADAALITFVDMYKTTGGDFVISDGETIDDTTPLDSGKRIFRRSNRKV